MSTTTTSTTTSKKKQQQAEVPLALANGFPPDLDAMKRAAVVLKVPAPAGNGEAPMRELLGALRLEMKKRLKPVPKGDQLVCQQCGERSTDDTDFCPFCGDQGVADDEALPEQGISSAPVLEPERDVEGALSNLAGELDDRLARLSELKLGLVDSTYDMGVLVKEIHDRQLYKAKGYDNFKQFAEKELPFSRQTAYQLVQITEKFDKKTYLEVGFRKLKTIASIDDSAERDRALSQAKSGVSARALEGDTASNGKRPARTAGPTERGKTRAAAPPPEDGKVTLLGKLDGKAREVQFKSVKSGGPLQSAGKVTMVVADAYGEIEIAHDVFLRIGLRVSGKDLVGLSAELVRAKS